MKCYEGMFILHNRELPEGETTSPEDVVVALVEKCGGQVAHKLVWTSRKLAYPIKGNQTGTYVLTYFTGETDTGWQTATFAQPVAVSAGTSYVVSYTDPSGHYAVQKDAFWYRARAGSEQ